MRCASCGGPNEDYALTCLRCGLPLTASHRAVDLATVGGARRDPRGGSAARAKRWLAGAIVIAAAAPLAAMFAAVAIPKYRDYAIRSQVAEGLALATKLEDAVATAWEADGRRFSNVYSESLPGAVETRGKHVESVDVVNGAIVVRFGDAADDALRGRTLTLVPALDTAGRRVAWQCGRGDAPAGFESIFDEPGRFTDVANEYLPDACRGR